MNIRIEHTEIKNDCEACKNKGVFPVMFDRPLELKLCATHFKRLRETIEAFNEIRRYER